MASQEIQHHHMASNQGITNQNLLLCKGIEEGAPQYPPGYFFNHRPQREKDRLQKFSNYSDVVLKFLDLDFKHLFQ